MTAGNHKPDHLNERFARSDAGEILKWSQETFGSALVATSSFQTQSLPLLHLISVYAPTLRLCFLDTGFHFPETLEYVATLRERLGLHVEVLRPLLDHEAFLAKYGELYGKDPSLCCYLNKVEPMTRALSGVSAWISGVRQDQTSMRASLGLFNRQPNGILKICPMVNWSAEEVDDYIRFHDLPVHPLFPKGYRSIGCAPCTRPVAEGDDPRTGRWSGQSKTECGLHNRI